MVVYPLSYGWARWISLFRATDTFEGCQAGTVGWHRLRCCVIHARQCSSKDRREETVVKGAVSCSSVRPRRLRPVVQAAGKDENYSSDHITDGENFIQKGNASISLLQEQVQRRIFLLLLGAGTSRWTFRLLQEAANKFRKWTFFASGIKGIEQRRLSKKLMTIELDNPEEVLRPEVIRWPR